MIERRKAVAQNKAYGNPHKSDKLSAGSRGRLDANGSGVNKATENNVIIHDKGSIVEKLHRFEQKSIQVGNPQTDKTSTSNLVDDILGGE